LDVHAKAWIYDWKKRCRDCGLEISRAEWRILCMPEPASFRAWSEYGLRIFCKQDDLRPGFIQGSCEGFILFIPKLALFGKLHFQALNSRKMARIFRPENITFFGLHTFVRDVINGRKEGFLHPTFGRTLGTTF
jgi:hypothetical protein